MPVYGGRFGDDGIEEAYLGSDYTSPAFRKQGIWNALLAARLEYGCGLGLTRASSCCRTDNQIIKAAFLRNGFEVKSIVTGQMPDGSVVEGYHMEKALCPTLSPRLPARPALICAQGQAQSYAFGDRQ